MVDYGSQRSSRRSWKPLLDTITERWGGGGVGAGCCSDGVGKKINTCFGVHVRGSEYMPLLGSDDPTSFLLAVPDFEI
ncbi:hypothetical protein ACFX2C_020800 [Malus domestica]|uniref:Uncharacterized protein n=1 Tax=Malus domestica TaxID=3750 RepID=A0A498HJG5_MALDO|nr:hypothetical protein DVH24_007298 [Malus domestica]